MENKLITSYFLALKQQLNNTQFIFIFYSMLVSGY
jgi:hypothetical protein